MHFHMHPYNTRQWAALAKIPSELAAIGPYGRRNSIISALGAIKALVRLGVAISVSRAERKRRLMK